MRLRAVELILITPSFNFEYKVRSKSICRYTWQMLYELFRNEQACFSNSSNRIALKLHRNAYLVT